jgi:folate-binding protein YgfZ
MPIAQLDDRAVVRVTGPDGETLLQNVITADMGALPPGGAAYAALLSPQGKVQTDFILHRIGEGYAIDVRADDAAAFVRRLGMYRLRAKVEIALDDGLAVFAAWPAVVGRATDPRLAALGSRFVAPRDSVASDAATADWHRHRIRLAVPEGGVDFVFGETFPHDAGLDALHGIAFEKGCFVGQEVVSRMRHRGTARRRVVAIRSRDPLPPPGSDISAAGQVVGRVGSSVDGYAIGIARLDRLRRALDAGAAVSAGDAALSVLLPDWADYSWPTAALAGED